MTIVISGTVTKEGAPAQATLWLYDKDTRAFVEEVTSDPGDGTYSFGIGAVELSAGTEYDVLARYDEDTRPLAHGPVTGFDTNQSVLPAAGTVVLTGYVATVLATGHVWVSPGVGTLSIAGQAPTVVTVTIVFHALTYDEDTYEFLPLSEEYGVGAATQGRSSERYALNNEGLYYSVPAYESAINGGRNVQNETRYSEELTNAVWVKTNGTATATVFTATSGNATCLQTLTKAASDRIYACTIGRVTGTGTIEITTDGGTTWVDITSSVEATAKRFTCNKSAEANPQYGIRLVTSGDEASFTYHQNEDAAGRADTTTPSEYCPTDTVGAGDPTGYKVFANANGNSVASNVVTEAVGTPLTELPWYSACPAATNSITYSDDITNEDAWASSQITKSRNQIGITGKPNTATLITKSISSYVNQSFTGAGTTNSIRVWVKKDSDVSRFPCIATLSNDNFVHLNTSTGDSVEEGSSGYNNEVIDGGDWWILIIDHVDATSEKVRIYPARGTVFGVRNDAAAGSCIIGQVEVRLNKTIAEARGLPPIFTGGAAVSTTADDLYYDLLNHSQDQGAYYFEWIPSFAYTDQSANELMLSLVSGPGLMYLAGPTGIIISYDGTQYAQLDQDHVANVILKIGLVYDASEAKMRICINGVWSDEQTYDGAYAISTALRAMYDNDFEAGMRDLRRYNLSYTAAQAQIDALMINYLTGDSFTDRLTDESANDFTV